MGSDDITHLLISFSATNTRNEDAMTTVMNGCADANGYKLNRVI